ncbi:hypothetical protein [Oricola cellulosilytica]|uniref:XRE family transcriptional regulator n=1 Tax=Oricola cellulosilytica TaxID=1429082 RepID=A0A4R0PHX9_9HYPH|nr:hypothetical protein [Oricola cellulosilytica]TCD15164.1 hypothetical protein E0D97_06340 [Oricola cellulosilytica]
MDRHETLMPIDDLFERAGRINVSMAELSRDAGVHNSTASRIRAGADPNRRTHLKLQRALLNREALLLEHLTGLQPHAEGEGAR